MSPWTLLSWLHTLRPRQNGCHFTDNTFKCISQNENAWIALKFVPKVLINNIPVLDKIMTWCQQGHKPLSETMIVRLLMHICITRPEWVNAKEMYISIADTLELRLFCIKPLTKPPNVPKFQEHVPKKNGSGSWYILPESWFFFYHFPLFRISIPSTWQKLLNFSVNYSWRFFSVGGSASIWSSDITNVLEFPSIKTPVASCSCAFFWTWHLRAERPMAFLCSEVNALKPSDATWHHRSWWAVVQVMTCCLTAPSHYLNQCWLIISKVLWHSLEGNLTRIA